MQQNLQQHKFRSHQPPCNKMLYRGDESAPLSSGTGHNALSVKLCWTDIHHASHSPQRYPPESRNAGKVGMGNFFLFFQWFNSLYRYSDFYPSALPLFRLCPTPFWSGRRTIPAVVQPVADVSLTKVDNKGKCLVPDVFLVG